MKTIVKTFIILLICTMMAMPVSAAYHSVEQDHVGAYGVMGASASNSYLTPWVDVPQWLRGTWEIHGWIYTKKGRYYYRATGKTWWSPWTRMYGWTYKARYITGYDLHGGWYD